MNTIIKFLTCIMWAALIAFIAYFILYVLMQLQLDYMKDSGGVILASELLSINYVPPVIGILIFISILFVKKD